MEIPYTVTARPDTGLWNAKIGIWLFLASEVMLFGGLFSGYVFLRLGVTEGLDNPWPIRQLDVLPGFINTLVLIASSVFVVLAWSELKMRNFQKYRFWMSLVVICALAFVVIKSVEYYGKFTHHGMKFTDNTVVEGVLKKDVIIFEASEVVVNIGDDRLEFMKDFDATSGAPRFRTADGAEITLDKAWMRKMKKEADKWDAALEDGGTSQQANRLITLKAAQPLKFNFRPRKVRNHDATSVTYRDNATIRGNLIDDKIVFEVHDIDMRLADNMEESLLWNYLHGHEKDEFFQHREEQLEKFEEMGAHGVDPKEYDTLHLHADAHDAEGHGYPVITVDRADKKFLAAHGPRYSTYYAIYFTMTGLHAVHVIAGALVLAYFLFFQKALYKKNPEHLANRVEVGGLFWHFVDLVWIFLFPIMYLM